MADMLLAAFRSSSLASQPHVLPDAATGHLDYGTYSANPIPDLAMLNALKHFQTTVPYSDQRCCLTIYLEPHPARTLRMATGPGLETVHRQKP